MVDLAPVTHIWLVAREVEDAGGWSLWFGFWVVAAGVGGFSVVTLRCMHPWALIIAWREAHLASPAGGGVPCKRRKRLGEWQMWRARVLLPTNRMMK